MGKGQRLLEFLGKRIRGGDWNVRAFTISRNDAAADDDILD